MTRELTDDRLHEYSRKMKTFSKVAVAAAVLAILMSYAAPAQAQQAWNTNIITLVAPTTCTTGQPITSCPITGYQIERSSTVSGTFVAIATITGLSYTHTNVTAGTNCYRAIVLSAQGPSGPSNVSCKTNTPPVGPPNPAVLNTVALNAAQTPFVPVMRANKLDTIIGSTVLGLVPVGRECGKCVASWRGKRWCKVQVAQAELWGTTDASQLTGPCA